MSSFPLMRPSLLPLLPILLLLLCLSALWKDCEAKSSRLVGAKLEPPEGLEWLRDAGEEEANEGRMGMGKRKRQWAEEDDQIRVDFGPLRGEALRRFDNSYSLFEVEEDEEEEDDGPELGEPIPWFAEWERMVASGNGGRGRVKMSKLMTASKKNAVHGRLSFSNSPSPPPPPSSDARRPFRHLRQDQPCLHQREHVGQHRTYPRSYEFPGFEASIPRQWDWRNVSGVNYCSPNRNQHIPVYCGGCWVFGTLGMLNDRFNVARKNRWPMTFLSPQEIIACNGRGSCNGGTAEDVFEHSKTVGLVEEGCNNYKAVNEKCTPLTRCSSCWPDNCFAIQNYTRYYIKDYGQVNGRLQMMSEIHNRGPIACSVGCTGNFDMNYTSGIFQEFGENPFNHIVSVTGWGWDEESKTEYWIVRNSWGDAWGEDGWFRIVTSLYRGGRGDQYNLGIERQCYFADPDISNLKN